MNRKNFILDYAKRELEKANFKETYTYDAVLNYISAICDITLSQESSLIMLHSMVENLLQCQPITEITEKDFSEISTEYKESSKILRRCNRYPSVYQTIDGKYWDDKAVVFITHDQKKLFLYQKKYNSKKQITLPYLPKTKIIQIDSSNNI